MNELIENNLKEIKNKSLEMIGNGQLEHAIDYLKNILKYADNNLFPQLVFLSGKIAEENHKIRLGLNDDKKLNNLIFSLIQFVKDLDNESKTKKGIEEKNIPEENQFTPLLKFLILLISKIASVLLILKIILATLPIVYPKEIKFVDYESFDDYEMELDNVSGEKVNIPPISFNVTKDDNIALVFNFSEKNRNDTFRVNVDYRIIDLKNALIDNYRIISSRSLLMVESAFFFTDKEYLTLEHLIQSGEINEYDRINIFKGGIVGNKNQDTILIAYVMPSDIEFDELDNTDNISISWSLATERNNSGFEIELNEDDGWFSLGGIPQIENLNRRTFVFLGTPTKRGIDYYTDLDDHITRAIFYCEYSYDNQIIREINKHPSDENNDRSLLEVQFINRLGLKSNFKLVIIWEEIDS